ncbi:uncharacterized protein AMSG_10698 [Thecamonas trahens ATCC 50062]|uniref:Guanylate cyclase domain-containing protein n=1 Tax=Thecamonas trahens ATCC 50062 TaxID=461836 RepID=A0A0L0DS58_THETB|nr:hypothetical protein AMSG_10698 [Thecamonas trahens ATCC 50062]KNC55100.1 hypothetical protein AMSG_10698 [Thecamonas trahens ATCC 50062]|eukprot:XP_013753284.1 hypothetical protein AMSG_10698 [Thecamonas trahens ATCC 50062]
MATLCGATIRLSAPHGGMSYALYESETDTLNKYDLKIGGGDFSASGPLISGETYAIGDTTADISFPTRLPLQPGKYYALMLSLTNSASFYRYSGSLPSSQCSGAFEILHGISKKNQGLPAKLTSYSSNTDAPVMNLTICPSCLPVPTAPIDGTVSITADYTDRLFHGDTATCLGCDGVPIPLGGAYFDACGVCGGPAVGSCLATCDNSSAVTVVFDCAGVCNGSAIIDECGVCVGGTTGRPALMHLDSCGDCFARCEGCSSGTADVCGVCAGDNSTCIGCDGFGGVVDACGECGGNGTSCIQSCNPALGPYATFDCAGVCGGSASIDSCGMCTGGTTGIAPNIFLDACGVCFGGNAGRDSCGVCFGGNADRDACQVCFGRNAARDSCGVCFGGGRLEDACGVCYGNSTSCAGCDAVPNSGVVIDGCGVCGGNGATCEQAFQATPGIRDPEVIAIASSSAAGCVALAFAFLVLVRIRRRRAHAAYLLGKMADQNAPDGRLAVLISDVQSSTMLWEAYPEAMADAIDMHNATFRSAIAQHNGYEVRTEGDSFVVVFRDAVSAVRAAITIQERLMELPWPAAILDDETLVSQNGPGAIWHGLRVRMGISMAEPSREFVERTQRFSYEGPDMVDAQSVGDCGVGGQIVVDADVVAGCARTELDFTHLGRYTCGSARGEIVTRSFELYEAVIPRLSAGRCCGGQLRGMTPVVGAQLPPPIARLSSSLASSSTVSSSTSSSSSSSSSLPDKDVCAPPSAYAHLEIDIQSDMVDDIETSFSPVASSPEYRASAVARIRTSTGRSGMRSGSRGLLSPHSASSPRVRSADDAVPTLQYPSDEAGDSGSDLWSNASPAKTRGFSRIQAAFNSLESSEGILIANGQVDLSDSTLSEEAVSDVPPRRSSPPQSLANALNRTAPAMAGFPKTTTSKLSTRAVAE